MERPSILVAEDELIIGLDLCATLEEAGFDPNGPYPDLGSAMLAAQKTRPDLAILDVQLEDGEVFPFADKLMAERVPVIFHSAQIRPGEMVAHYPDAVACEKPCPPSQLIRIAHTVLARA